MYRKNILLDTKILDNKMREKMCKYYVAYGTNLNTGEFRIKKKCSLGYKGLE